MTCAIELRLLQQPVRLTSIGSIDYQMHMHMSNDQGLCMTLWCCGTMHCHHGMDQASHTQTSFARITQEPIMHQWPTGCVRSASFRLCKQLTAHLPCCKH